MSAENISRYMSSINLSGMDPIQIGEAPEDIRAGAAGPEDSSTIDAGETVRLKSTRGGATEGLTGTVRVDGEAVGVLSPTPTEDDPVATDIVRFDATAGTSTITVGGEKVAQLLDVESGDDPGRQNNYTPEENRVEESDPDNPEPGTAEGVAQSIRNDVLGRRGDGAEPSDALTPGIGDSQTGGEGLGQTGLGAGVVGVLALGVALAVGWSS